MESPTGPSWAETRRENARLQAERLAARKEAESAQAQEYLHQFADSARRLGLKPEPLMMQGFAGKGLARTPLTGWYLRADKSMGIDTAGNFYLLKAELTVKERLSRKVDAPRPAAPPLILGYGGRDGESMDLTDALSQLLPGWRSPSVSD